MFSGTNRLSCATTWVLGGPVSAEPRESTTTADRPGTAAASSASCLSSLHATSVVAATTTAATNPSVRTRMTVRRLRCGVARIVIYAICYRGDVFPYAPVAAELARRGHDVTFVAPAELLPQLAADGVRLADADAGEMTPSALDRYGDYCARWGKVASGAMLMPLYYRRLTVPRLDPLLAAIEPVAEGADLLVSHPGAAPIAAMPFERRGIPFMVGDLFPMLTRTSDHPPEGLVPFRTGTSTVARRAERARVAGRREPRPRSGASTRSGSWRSAVRSACRPTAGT